MMYETWQSSSDSEAKLSEKRWKTKPPRALTASCTERRTKSRWLDQTTTDLTETAGCLVASGPKPHRTSNLLHQHPTAPVPYRTSAVMHQYQNGQIPTSPLPDSTLQHQYPTAPVPYSTLLHQYHTAPVPNYTSTLQYPTAPVLYSTLLR